MELILLIFIIIVLMPFIIVLCIACMCDSVREGDEQYDYGYHRGYEKGYLDAIEHERRRS